MTAPASSRLRPEIAESWQRVSMAGLDTDVTFESLVAAEVDLVSSLLVGAEPVLDELEESLRGSNLATFLVDRDCRIVRQWFDDSSTREGFGSLNIQLGTCLLEESIGTNALGTVMETRHGIAINGSEHYAEALRGFSCYGHPIRHPLTRRIEGVLDVSMLGDQTSPLLPPLIARAVRDIEQRLLDGSRTSEKSLLSAFQEAAGLRRRAIVAIGEDIVLSNQAAADLLSPGDVALLRVLSEEPVHNAGQVLELTLESGRAVCIEVTKVSGARRGALLKVDPFTGERAESVARRSGTERRVGAPILITGVPGSGRTTRARELATAKPVQFLRPAAALVGGGHSWAQEFERAMQRGGGSVCIDGIDLLPDTLLDLVIESLDLTQRPHLLLTSGPLSELSGRAATLAAMATRREELVPLAARRKDIPGLLASMLKACGEDDSIHLSPSVIAVLTAQPWPGNLRELKAVVVHAAQRRRQGTVVVDDLPKRYRTVAPTAPLAALDQAEHDVIVAALRDAGGNKVRAAHELGMSRTTLYARIRSLHITTY